MILKLVGHAEKHQIKIHISIGIYSENVNLGFGPGFLEMILKLVGHSENIRLKFTFPSVFTVKM